MVMKFKPRKAIEGEALQRKRKVRLPSRKRKGQALIVPAIALVLILVGLLAYINVPLIKSGEIEKDVEVRSEIHTMGNALDAAKLYTETALAYSTYQGCYDNLQKGGWETIYSEIRHAGTGLATWSEGKYPDTDQFIGNLQDSINASLELYRKSSYKFMTDYYVDMPSHNIIFSDYYGSIMGVSASSDRNFFIEKTQESGEYIRLEKDSSIQAYYDIDCYGIYNKGVEAFSQARGKINQIIQDFLSQGKTDADSASFRSSVQSALGTQKNEGDYRITYEVLSATITPGTVGPSGTSYVGTAYVNFTITNTKQQFPVYDGKNVVFSNMELVFVGKFDGT